MAFYAVAICLAFSVFTSLLVRDVEKRMFFPYWPTPGPLFPLYSTSLILSPAIAIRTLFKLRRQSPLIIRTDLTWAALALTIAYVGGLTNQFLWFSIPIPPYLNILVAFCIGIIALLFFRLGLFDVKSVMKHAVGLALVYGLILAIALPSMIPLTQKAILKNEANITLVLIIFGVIVGVILSTGPFIYAYLLRHRFWLKRHVTVGLAHELKSPLAAIQGAAEFISDDLENTALQLPKSKAYVEMIRKNADRLEQCITDLLSLARAQEAEFTLERSLTDLSRIVIEEVEAYRALAEIKGLKIHTNLNETDPAQIDREKIRKVLSNLLSNAIKFSSKGIIRVELKKRPKEVLCEVKDQGDGIICSDMKHIFDRFYQGKNAKGGSGIGLTIAKAWVEAHGGRIWAESEGEGNGTKVTFTLPVDG